MSKSIEKIAFPTPAGTVVVPKWLGDPWLPALKDDVVSLHRHIMRIGISTDVWNTWCDMLGIVRVSDVKTLATLFHLWMLVCSYQRSSSKSVAVPSSDLGFIVYEQHFLPYLDLKGVTNGQADRRDSNAVQGLQVSIETRGAVGSVP